MYQTQFKCVQIVSEKSRRVKEYLFRQETEITLRIRNFVSVVGVKIKKQRKKRKKKTKSSMRNMGVCVDATMQAAKFTTRASETDKTAKNVNSRIS